MASRPASLTDSDHMQTRPLTDGGRPAIALGDPVEAGRLATFLAEHDDAPAFEVTYTEGETQRPALLYEFELARGTFKRVDVTPSARCLPLDPGEEVYYIPVASLERVAVADPPPDRYTAAAETPVEEARGVRRLAEGNPARVPLPKLLALLEAGDSGPRREALKALKAVAAVRAGDCRPAIPILRSGLEESGRFVTRDAMTVLRRIGEDTARDIAPLSDDLKPFLRSEDRRVRREATRCIAAIAAEDASAVVDATPDLATIIADRSPGLSDAVHALSRLSREYPDRVRPVGSDLGEIVCDESLSEGTRLNATAALGQIVEEFPSVGLEVVEDLEPLLESKNHKLRNNAVGLLGAVAIVHSDAVEPYTDAIADLLQVEDPHTRAHATAALSRVAQDFPGAVADLTPLLKTCLADDVAQVRKNACWALGYLEAEEATSQLAETARQDEDEGVRRRASWAVDRCRSC